MPSQPTFHLITDGPPCALAPDTGPCLVRLELCSDGAFAPDLHLSFVANQGKYKHLHQEELSPKQAREQGGAK